ncbi:MAG: Calx-beta domain-containing protein, partial [Verrucomicrobiota bacterium]
PVIVGNNLVYTHIVTNRGPATATAVVLTNPLPSGVAFGGATVSQGTFTIGSGFVLYNFGTLASNTTATATLTVQPIIAGTLITNLAQVSATQPDYELENNATTTLTTVNVPTISIMDTSVGEGGINAIFSITLSAISSQTVSINYTTADDTTTADLDYFSTNGVVTFAPGETNKTVTVRIKEDSINESTEFFFVNLSGPVNVTIEQGQAVGTITDNDPLPAISIADASVAEGNSGTNNINFVVSLVPVSGQPVMINYVTSNGTAQAGSDYVSSTGTVIFSPGETNQIISIAVKSDSTNELNETFFVNLANQVNATVSRAQAVGTIINDDLFPTIGAVGFIVTAESCVPTNRLIDASETVTVNFALRNVGTGTANSSSNLTATLLSGGGIVPASGPQIYGVLATNGATVSRAFTFTANGDCGSTIPAVLQLQDGTNNLGTVTNFLLLGTFSMVTNSYINPNGMVISSFGGASPYPSTVDVSGLIGAVANVSITLSNFTHAYPADVDMLLVAPSGETVLLMSDAGFGFPVSNLTLTLDDGASNSFPQSTQLFSGIFKPTNYDSNDAFDFPAPVEPFGTTLSTLYGINPNGTWSLYIMDDTGGDGGSLDSWKLTLTSLADPICCGVNSSADLATTITDSPDPLTVGSNLTFTISVTNRGPYSASSVAVLDPLPSSVDFISATSTIGTCTNQNGTLVCNLGTLGLGQKATITLNVVATQAGPVTNSVTVTSTTSDPVSTNNTAISITTVLPIVSLFTAATNAAEPGTAASYTVSRTGGAAATLTVKYAMSGTASNGVDYTLLSGSLNFPIGSTNATITVAPIDDFLVEPTESVMVSLLSDPAYALDTTNLAASATSADNDFQSLLVSTNSLSVAEGGTNSLTVRLTAQPTNIVTVTTAFTSGDTNLSLSSGGILNFNSANWNVPQTVFIRAVRDLELVNGQALFTISSPALSNVLINATQVNNDVLALVASTNLVSVAEGGTNGFTVQLNVQPTNAIAVTTVRTSGETNLNVFAGTSLSFTTNNWNLPQTIILSDGEDLNAFNGQAIFTMSSSGLSNLPITAVEIENDVQLIVLSSNSLTVLEGQTNGFTIRLSAQPTNNVVVTTSFSSGDTNLSAAFGTNSTFNSTNWNIPQT